MVFSTPIFIFCFLPLVLLLYHITLHLHAPLKIGNFILILTSLFFYAWGEPIYVSIMILSIIINYLFGLGMQSKNKRMLLVLAIICNLGILIIFKYTGFIIENINAISGKELIYIPNIIMPIGISFFTFQAVSYVIDVYRKETPINRNIWDIALYISFFPQLIAGPIVRYHDINEQIKNRKHTLEQFSSGIYRFVTGLSKKVLIANVMAKLCDNIYNIPNNSYGGWNDLTAVLAWIGAIAYMLQIYFDFSGYSDMAIGLARMFGFELLENFKYPYMSRNIREFWTRWHISLSTWFRDYLYIPLGGNRKGKTRMVINQWIVMLLCGLWHGANWTFVIWGAYHATLQMLEKTYIGKLQKRLWVPLQHLYALFAVLIGWVLFRSESILDAVRFLGSMFGANGMTSQFMPVLSYVTPEMMLIFIIGILASTDLMVKIGEKVKAIRYKRFKELLLWAGVAANFILLFLAVAAISGNSYNPFIYFRF